MKLEPAEPPKTPLGKALGYSGTITDGWTAARDRGRVALTVGSRLQFGGACTTSGSSRLGFVERAV